MNFLDYLLSSMTNAQPSQGGLLATNYPNPYGLRAFMNQDGTYGGQMMPKTTGWQGIIPSLQGGAITEYSLGGNTPKEPFYPMVTQDMTPQMIKNTQLLEAGLLSQESPEARALKENAYKQYLKLNKQGKSAFKDYN